MNGIQFELFGHEFAWLNNWYSVELVIAYYAWTTLAFVGVLQASAGTYARAPLAVMPKRRPLLVAAGAVLWLGGLVGFYVTNYRLLFVPGPATTEAVFIIGGAALTAATLTRSVAWLAKQVGPMHPAETS